MDAVGVWGMIAVYCRSLVTSLSPLLFFFLLRPQQTSMGENDLTSLPSKPGQQSIQKNNFQSLLYQALKMMDR